MAPSRRQAAQLTLLLTALTLLAALPAPAAAEKFEPHPPALPQPLLDAATAWTGERAYLFGGRNASGPRDAIWAFDPANGTTERLADTLEGPRQSATAVWTGERAYVLGGASLISVYSPVLGQRVLELQPTATVEAFNPGNETSWAHHASLPDAVFGMASAWTGEAAYLFGGMNRTLNDTGQYASYSKDWVLRFHPNATGDGAFERVATLPHPARDMAAAASGAHVYLFGGIEERVLDDGTRVFVASDRILRFSPATGAVQEVDARLPGAMRWSATVAVNGSAYLFGGCLRHCTDPVEDHVATVLRFDFENETLHRLYPTLPSPRAASMAFHDGERVYVLGGRGPASYSDVLDEILAFVPGPTEPSAPRNLTANATTGGVTLDWSAPLDDGGAPLEGYMVERATPDGAFRAIATVTADATTHTDASAHAGADYRYRVRAHGPGGAGPAGLFISVETPPEPPGPPQRVTAHGLPGAVLVRWDPPAVDGGRDVTHYVVHRDGRSPVNVTGLEFTDTGLAEGADHTYRVAAVNALGEGATSEPVNATPQDRLPPPENLTAAVVDGAVRLTWDAPATGDATGYTIRRGPTPDALAAVASTNTTSDDDATVERGVAYWYAVAATNATGEGVPTRAVRAAIVEPPGAPRNLTVRVTNEGATLHWDAPAEWGGAEELNYRVRRLSAERMAYVEGDAALTATAWTDTDMEAGAAYAYWVEAVNAAGPGPAAGPVNATGPSGNQAPQAVLSIPVVRAAPGETLHFDGSRSGDPDGTVTHARFNFGDGADTGWIPQLDATHAYAEPGAYRVSLRVRDDAGAESARPAEALVVIEGQAPTGGDGMQEPPTEDPGDPDAGGEGFQLPVPGAGVTWVAAALAITATKRRLRYRAEE